MKVKDGQTDSHRSVNKNRALNLLNYRLKGRERKLQKHIVKALMKVTLPKIMPQVNIANQLPRSFFSKSCVNLG